MTNVATRLTLAPLWTWVNTLLAPRKGTLPTFPLPVAVASVTTGAPNGGEAPINEASTENYYAYLPLFVP